MDNESREIHAKRLLEDPLFMEAFDATKEQLITEWKHTEPFDMEKRESLYQSIHLIDRILTHISSVLETGQMSQIQSKHPFI